MKKLIRYFLLTFISFQSSYSMENMDCSDETARTVETEAHKRKPEQALVSNRDRKKLKNSEKQHSEDGLSIAQEVESKVTSVGLQNLPGEIVELIAAYVGASDRPAQALKWLRNFELVCKNLRGCTKTKFVLDSVIRRLVKTHVNTRALPDAASGGDLASIEAFANTDIDLCQKDGFGRSALTGAGRTNNKRLLEFLLANGVLCNPSRNDRRNNNQILAAVIMGNKQKIINLIGSHYRWGIDDSCDHDKTTALMFAASNGDIEMIVLVASKPLLNKEDIFGNTALMYASRNGHDKAVQLLIHLGADIEAQNKSGYSALMFGAMFGHYEVVRVLLDEGASVDLQALDYSFEGAATKTATALHCAVHARHEKIVDLLIQKKANIDIYFERLPWSKYANIVDANALILAAYNGDLALVKLLIEHGADINEKAHKRALSALTYAAKNGHLEVVQLLVEQGADANDITIKQENDNGEMYEYASTPLGFAARYGHTAIGELLLLFGAEVDTRLYADQTALMIAAFDGKIDLMKLLLKYKADINAQDEFLRTPLLLAVQNNQLEAVRLLLEGGADPNVPANEGSVALKIALKAKNIEIGRLLIRYNADVTLVTNIGKDDQDAIVALQEIYAELFLNDQVLCSVDNTN